MDKRAAVLEELQKLADENGGLLAPSLVVDAARNPESPLHDEFEWDDSKAAHEYRIAQARKLIRVVVTILPQNQQQYRVFVSLHDDRVPDRGYRRMSDVLADEELRAQLLEEALIELRAWQRKYAQLTELSRVFAEVDRAPKPTRRKSSNAQPSQEAIA